MGRVTWRLQCLAIAFKRRLPPTKGTTAMTMTIRAVVWTHELAASARLIAEDRSPQPDREPLANDIRERARELVSFCRVGTPLTEIGVGCVQQFRSRIADPYVSFVGVEPFHRAWSEAWAEATRI
jgi:hypothetical protein